QHPDVAWHCPSQTPKHCLASSRPSAPKLASPRQAPCMASPMPAPTALSLLVQGIVILSIGALFSSVQGVTQAQALTSVAQAEASTVTTHRCIPPPVFARTPSPPTVEGALPRTK
ncbi:unnamed protein product, partial [Ilex paraguariensis]